MDKTTANSAVQYHWVLGATGFVGRNLIQELLDHYRENPLVQIVAVGHHRIDPMVMERTHFLMMPLNKIEKVDRTVSAKLFISLCSHGRK